MRVFRCKSCGEPFTGELKPGRKFKLIHCPVCDSMFCDEIDTDSERGMCYLATYKDMKIATKYGRDNWDM